MHVTENRCKGHATPFDSRHLVLWMNHEEQVDGQQRVEGPGSIRLPRGDVLILKIAKASEKPDDQIATTVLVGGTYDQSAPGPVDSCVYKFLQ